MGSSNLTVGAVKSIGVFRDQDIARKLCHVALDDRDGRYRSQPAPPQANIFYSSTITGPSMSALNGDEGQASRQYQRQSRFAPMVSRLVSLPGLISFRAG